MVAGQNRPLSTVMVPAWLLSAQDQAELSVAVAGERPEDTESLGSADAPAAEIDWHGSGSLGGSCWDALLSQSAGHKLSTPVHVPRPRALQSPHRPQAVGRPHRSLTDSEARARPRVPSTDCSPPGPQVLSLAGYSAR